MSGLGPKWTQGIPKAEEAEPPVEPGRRPQRRERTPFEGVSVVFGAVIVLFGLWGAIETLIDGPGANSGAFVICVVFVLLGAGRVWFGLRPPPDAHDRDQRK